MVRCTCSMCTEPNACDMHSIRDSFHTRTGACVRRVSRHQICISATNPVLDEAACLQRENLVFVVHCRVLGKAFRGQILVFGELWLVFRELKGGCGWRPNTSAVRYCKLQGEEAIVSFLKMCPYCSYEGRFSSGRTTYIHIYGTSGHCT